MARVVFDHVTKQFHSVTAVNDLFWDLQLFDAVAKRCLLVQKS